MVNGQWPAYASSIGKVSRAQFMLELKQISEISGYPFQIHYPDTGFELFRIVANYLKQL